MSFSCTACKSALWIGTATMQTSVLPMRCCATMRTGWTGHWALVFVSFSFNVNKLQKFCMRLHFFFEMAPQGSHVDCFACALKGAARQPSGWAPQGSHVCFSFVLHGAARQPRLFLICSSWRRQAATFVSHLFFMAPQGSHVCF